MGKRDRLSVIYDILKIIQDNHNSIKPTPLLRKSNLSTLRFKQYYEDLLKKELIKETENKGKFVNLTEKGFRFLDKYKTILNFIDEFDL